ncbi:uncharacterized protein BCR38DRAFT_353396 [Pseudomassariella vexata]|uniref:Tetratricopeptide repeat-domain-containing protein n=1 Tax=Pseudomassariella vexata TaxID=1141098 RepID=A0A1Y2DGL8_9PEZI|nr:uncharacterized protein BCR38DRAFT_353396 [Pseudomassariella vexata]ORY58224.1 hypothetical protein BCR38DRAFT_353396 [Pseudomassariella vexata]
MLVQCCKELNATDQNEDRRTPASVGDYLFISVNKDRTSFEIHRLVQIATQKWLNGEGQQERWKQQFISVLCAELPNGEYENWSRCRTLLPHARSAATQRPKEEASLQDWATVLYKTTWYLLRMGNGSEAEKLSTAAMNVRIKILGRKYKDTADAITMAGLAYDFMGRWEAAEKLLIETMETRKQKPRADHPSTLTSMANLASTYRNQGRWETAEKLEVEVMETSKQKLGVDHPSTLASMNDLAFTWHRLG